MELKDLRNEIDKIDDELVRLFGERMDIAAQIADYKKEHHLPILVPTREREKLQDVAKKAGPEMANYTRVLYSMLFELSRTRPSEPMSAVPCTTGSPMPLRTPPSCFPRHRWWPARV